MSTICSSVSGRGISAGNVGCDHRIGRVPQGMIRGQRFRIGHIQSGPGDPPPIERIAEGIRVDGRPPPHIQDDGALFEQADPTFIHHVISGWIARQAHGHHIRFRQKAVQFFHGIQTIQPLRRISHMPPDSLHAAAQRLHLPAESHTDIPQPHHEDLGAFDHVHKSLAFPPVEQRSARL